MRILQVIDTLSIGGAERVLVDLSNLLAKKGHEVSVLTFLTPGPLSEELGSEIKRIDLRRTAKYSLALARKFISTANEYDIVHIHMRHVVRYYFYCSFFFPCRAKVIFHDHWGEIDLQTSVPLVVKWLKHRIFYVGVSKKLSEWAVNAAGFDTKRVFCLPNIVAIDFNSNRSEEDGKRVLMISNFKRTKNIGFALEVIKEMQRRDRVELDIYGADLNKPYLDEINCKVRELGLEKSVRIILNQPNVKSKIVEYNLAIHTSISESGPLTLIEYLGNQVPFLSYKTGEVSDQLGPVLSNYFMDHFDASEWAARMWSLLDKKVQYPTEKLREYFNGYYSTESYVSSCEEIYRQVQVIK